MHNVLWLHAHQFNHYKSTLKCYLATQVHSEPTFTLDLFFPWFPILSNSMTNIHFIFAVYIILSLRLLCWGVFFALICTQFCVTCLQFTKRLHVDDASPNWPSKIFFFSLWLKKYEKVLNVTLCLFQQQAVQRHVNTSSSTRLIKCQPWGNISEFEQRYIRQSQFMQNVKKGHRRQILENTTFSSVCRILQNDTIIKSNGLGMVFWKDENRTLLI